MYPKLKLKLYHGTIPEITRVDVKAGKNHKDFGKGFYMATTKQQAIGMMHKKYREAIRRSRDKNNVTFCEHLYEIYLDENVLRHLNIKIFE